MRRRLPSLLCATTLLIAGASMLAIPQQTAAQGSMRIGFDFFHNRLVRDGRWIRHPIWGDVWRPRANLVGPDFQPYTNGYWEYTDDYGWYWVSNDPFDDVVYHYGRWVYDPQWNWLWVPGYTWSPAWVVWREGDEYTGWMPMPPDEDFISGSGPGFGVSIGPIGIDFYNRWYGSRVDPDRFFVFVGNRNLVDRDYRRFVVPRDRVKIIIKRTRPITKIEVVNNHVVNRGIDVRIVERATGRRIAPVSAKTVIKPGAMITTVNEAKQIRQRERVAHPIDINAARRGDAGGGNAGGGNANGGKPEGPPATNGNAGTAPATGTNTENGERMRNPGGESMTGPSNDQQPKKNRARGNANGNAGTGESTTAPDQTVAPPTGGTETTTPRRARGGSNSGTTDQTTPDATGASPENTGASPNENTPRRRGGNSGRVNGPSSTAGGNGAAQTQGGATNGPAAGNQGAQTPQPGGTDAEPKKKRKPKSPPTQEPGSPE